MKRNLAMLIAFIMGINIYPLSAVAVQEQEEGVRKEDASNSIDEISEAKEKVKGSAESEIPIVTTLEIPQKLEVIIDPWELDGKGQIYSESYTIRNVGEKPGILTLAFACKPEENSEVIIRADREGLHDNEDKCIYIKALFGNEEESILSREGSEYKTELEPGEELFVCFTGEVNENASDGWGSSGIEVEGLYSWETEELDKANEKEFLEAAQQKEIEQITNDKKNYATPSNAELEEVKSQQDENEGLMSGSGAGVEKEDV